MVVLCVSLLAVTFLIWNNYRVKGETKKSYSIVLYDDAKRTNVLSNSLNTDDALRQNSITLYPEDLVSSELITDPVTDGGAGEKIVIKRAPHFFIEVDGTKKELRSWDTTVSFLISKSGLTLNPKDQVIPALNSKLLAGETIVIARVKEADIDVFEDVDFETVQKGDSSIPFGQKRVMQGGITGKIKKTYHVTYKNGSEVNRYLLSRETITAKQNKIVASGVIVGVSNYGDIYSGMTTSFYKGGYVGRYILVTNLANGKSVKVKIVDVGPTNGPILDLGIDAFRVIGGSTFHGHIDSVSVQLVD